MTIRETIRQAQGLMCALEAQRLINIVHENDAKLAENGKRISFLCGAWRDYVWPSYPQSLGELCLAEVEDTALRAENKDDPRRSIGVSWEFTDETGRYPDAIDINILWDDCRALRRALYHRRTA